MLTLQRERAWGPQNLIKSKDTNAKTVVKHFIRQPGALAGSSLELSGGSTRCPTDLRALVNPKNAFSYPVTLYMILKMFSMTVFTIIVVLLTGGMIVALAGEYENDPWALGKDLFAGHFMSILIWGARAVCTYTDEDIVVTWLSRARGVLPGYFRGYATG